MSRSKFRFFTYIALAMVIVHQAHADCAGASIQETQAHFANAQAHERAGKAHSALAAYVAAQEYTCEPNPVERPAAERAATLAKRLGQEAEQAQDVDKAFHLYDDGGLFADADRVLIALVRSRPDDPGVYSRARGIFQYRTSPAFQANNRVRLSITGAYTANPQHLAEVQAMPAVGAERAFKAEAAAFNEHYLREYVELVQARPEDPTDQAALQRHMTAMQAFHARWPQDPLKASRDALSLAHAWGAATTERSLSERIAAKRRERLEQRIVTITRSFPRAPELLDAAIDYQLAMHIDDSAKRSRVATIRNQAAQLGDQSAASGRLGLAAEFYRVAQLDDKAQAAREEQRRLAMTKLQPSFDAMRKQAEDLQAAFSDPEAVRRMQEEARAMQKAIEAQKNSGQKRGPSADELANELGL